MKLVKFIQTFVNIYNILVSSLIYVLGILFIIRWYCLKNISILFLIWSS